MSLHGSVMLNGRTLGIYEIRRTTEDVNEVNRYAWWWIGVDRDERYQGEIEHRYVYGAAALVAKVLAVVATKQQPREIPEQ